MFLKYCRLPVAEVIDVYAEDNGKNAHYNLLNFRDKTIELLQAREPGFHQVKLS
jgi:hypothetical protein